jgi:hypothetical protein
LEAKENLGVDTLPFWWIKATIMEIAQCINNITTIVAITTQEQAKKVRHATRLFGKFKYNDDIHTCPQGEI